MKKKLLLLSIFLAIAALPIVAGRLGYDEPVIGLMCVLLHGGALICLGIHCGTQLRKLWYMPFVCEGAAAGLNWLCNGWWYWEFRYYRIAFLACLCLMLCAGAIDHIASRPGKQEA